MVYCELPRQPLRMGIGHGTCHCSPADGEHGEAILGAMPTFHEPPAFGRWFRVYIGAMCGRFTLAAPEATLRELIGPADWSTRQTPRWNVAPGQEVLAVSESGGGRRVEAVRWGFTLPGRPAPLVNVRSETAAVRAPFRDALEAGRCVVPADAFYEWRGRGGQPYRVAVADGRVFGLAAIRGRDGGFAILTREADPAIAPIHDRMPVMLEAGPSWSGWLRGEDDLAAGRFALVAHPVSRRVNSVLNDDPECAASAPPEASQLGLW